MFRLNERAALNILSFPVKHGIRVLGALCLSLIGCGYRAVYAEGREASLCVVAAPPKVPDFGAVQAALDGAREELGRAGALSSEGQYPCLVVEVLRVSTGALGITADGSTGADQPRGRGVRTTVRARGWVEQTKGGPTSRDTGDLEREVALEVKSEVGAQAASDRRAAIAAAHDLGQDLARRVLGIPISRGSSPAP